MVSSYQVSRLSQKLTPSDAYVLIVEDKVDNYVTLFRLLVYAGVLPDHFEFKTSGLGIVQLADTLPRLDLILLDIGLPGEDGYEVLRQIRSSSQFQNTLVIAVTGHVSAEELFRAKKSGFDGFIGKPLDASRFPDQLADILCGKAVWEYR